MEVPKLFALAPAETPVKIDTGAEPEMKPAVKPAAVAAQLNDNNPINRPPQSNGVKHRPRTKDNPLMRDAGLGNRDVSHPSGDKDGPKAGNQPIANVASKSDTSSSVMPWVVATFVLLGLMALGGGGYFLWTTAGANGGGAVVHTFTGVGDSSTPLFKIDAPFTLQWRSKGQVQAILLKDAGQNIAHEVNASAGKIPQEGAEKFELAGDYYVTLKANGAWTVTVRK